MDKMDVNCTCCGNLSLKNFNFKWNFLVKFNIIINVLHIILVSKFINLF
jgi:hypothetical protein